MTTLSTGSSNKQARLPLTSSQVAVLVALGAILWFLAAMLLRIIGPMGVHEGLGRVVLYLLVVPGTFPFVLGIKKLARLADHQLALGVAVATATATLLDGIALAWFPALYGTDIQHFAGAGAVILWGAGVGLVYGLVMNRTDRA